MTPEPSPWSVSSCTTAGTSALATAAMGSSPALICEGVTVTGMPGADALALPEPRSRSCPRPKPAPTSSTTARTPATSREDLRRGGRLPPAGAGPPQDGPLPDGSPVTDGPGTGLVSAWPQGGAGLAEPQLAGPAPELGQPSRLQGEPAPCRPPAASWPQPGRACSWPGPSPGRVAASP